MKTKTHPESSRTTTLKVDCLARVEGEGALRIRIKDGKVATVKLNIFEPPRFFEAFLRGRHFMEVPDITARICGICPVAYQSASIAAMESICGITVSQGIRDLRRLMYCGEWIESHVLHVAMLHAPDFLGYQDALQMAKDHPDIVKAALRLKKLGNTIMEIVGGRAIHPINLCVGGFYRVPSRAEMAELESELVWAVDAATDLARWTGTLSFPDFERDYEFVALRHETEYPMWDGRLVSNRGMDADISEFYTLIAEEHVRHSTSLHSVIKERGIYHVGPLARYALNFDRLSGRAKSLAADSGLGPVCRNPFKSIIVRAIETVVACEDALRIVRNYTPPNPARIDVKPRAGRGHGCSEAPRGICYHVYEIDAAGVVRSARIAPPTAQNQKCMEEDLAEFVPRHLHLDDERLTWKCEQAIRNYDPCISCSCHFLKLEIDRDDAR